MKKENSSISSFVDSLEQLGRVLLLGCVCVFLFPFSFFNVSVAPLACMCVYVR